MNIDWKLVGEAILDQLGNNEHFTEFVYSAAGLDPDDYSDENDEKIGIFVDQLNEKIKQAFK